MRPLRLGPVCTTALLVAVAGLSCGGSTSTVSIPAAVTPRTLHLGPAHAATDRAAAAADLDHNGHAEILTIGDNGKSSILTVWMINSSGDLVTSATYDVMGIAQAVATGDVDGDGQLDVIVGSSVATGGEVTIFKNMGNGALRNIETALVPGADLVQVGDLNGDGRADVVAASRTTGVVTTMLGLDTGSVMLKGAWSIGAAPVSLALIDVDGDKSLDLVAQTTTASLDAKLAVLTGNGTGAFVRTGSIGVDGGVTIGGLALSVPLSRGIPVPVIQAVAMTYGSGAGSTLQVDDFNGDGRADLAVASGAGVELMLGQSGGGFKLGPTSKTNVSALTALDLDRSDQRNLAASGKDFTSTMTTVFGASSSGDLSDLAEAKINGIDNDLVAGDFNGDGYTDLAVLTTSSLTILLNSSE